MTSVRPTEAELEILQVLWSRGASTVREVHDQLTQRKPVVYTTVLKALQVMHEKGLVYRDDDQRSHVYVAAAKEENVKKTAVENVIDRVFGGSGADVAMHALSAKPASSEDIRRIRSLLDEIEERDNQKK